MVLVIYILVIFSYFHNCATYDITLFVNGGEKESLHWTVDHLSKQVYFSLTLSPLPLEAFGFGFSDRGDLANADLVVISVDKNTISLVDCWTDQQAFLHYDKSQDYKLIDASFLNESVTVSFKRSFDTCDVHDYTFDNGTTNLISVLQLPFASGTINFGSKDNSFRRTNLHDLSTFHSRAQLLKPQYMDEIQKKHRNFSILAPNITIPSKGTTYWCSLHRLPNLKRKTHSIGFESVISKDNTDLVHHIEVFGCDVNDELIAPYSGECDSLDQPLELDRCRHVLAAWAYGADTFFYPKEAGLTIFSTTKSQYVRLEIHYNNPSHLQGVNDQSGIRFFYADKLRPNEIGILETGVIYTPDMAIPPGQSSFSWTGICPTECTLQALPAQGINVFASEMHTHLAGQRIWTSAYRENNKISEIIRDNHYSTWFEEIRHITPPKIIMPGDVLSTTCEFGTRTRRNVTLGGLGIYEEMCVNYLYYYPATDLEVCKSSVSQASLSAFFEFQSLANRIFGKNSSKFINSYEKIKWDASYVSQLKSLYKRAPLNVHCLKPNRDEWKGSWKNIPKPALSSPQYTTNKCF